MSNNVQKVYISELTEVRHKCEEETEVSCLDPSWYDEPDTTRIRPPKDTVAIVVDMRNVTASSVQIFTTQDVYINEVDMDDRGFLVMVPWRSDWTYFCVGGCPVGIIRQRGKM